MLVAKLASAMAASSADDIPTQLAPLLAHIRKVDENPPLVSIIDVIAIINGKDKNQAAEDLRRISTGHPEVKAICFDFKFLAQGQRDTPVTDAKGIVEIIKLQPTKRATRVRRQATELLCWYVGVIWPLLSKCAGFAASRRNWRQ